MGRSLGPATASVGLEKTEPPLRGTVTLIGAQLLRQWEQEGECRTFHSMIGARTYEGIKKIKK